MVIENSQKSLCRDRFNYFSLDSTFEMYLTTFNHKELMQVFLLISFINDGPFFFISMKIVSTLPVKARELQDKEPF